jgi:uncharacterized membrane protein
VNTSRSTATVVLGIFCLAGAVFAAVSTHDYVAYLDRQVHAITCSFVPGLGTKDTTGTSGCHTVMMSPYSAVLRASTWGGIPISLPGLAVFAFLLFRVLDLLWRGRANDPGETRITLAATALPLVMSVVYLLISILKVGAVCKLCIGIYLSSLGAFVVALIIHRRAARAGAAGVPATGRAAWARCFAEGVLFVAIPVALYLALKPPYAATMADCGALRQPEDRYNVRVELSNPPGGVPAIELLDPLCPACKGFALRLDASGLAERLQLQAVLFPLDKQCNWMVSDSLHPGACAVSEAVLCAGVQAKDVLAWAFANGDELRELGRKDDASLATRLKMQFPQLSDCLGKPAVRARLNRSLRWAVSNSLPVVTPQLFVRSQKVCEEDTDLGLEYVLTRMLDKPVVAAKNPGAR